ncbi:hypothetical protein ACHAQA_003031 [Verticillium albo-atrum]
MFARICLLALASLTTATLEPRRLMHEARHLKPAVFHRQIGNSTSAPCKILSQAWESAEHTEGQGVIIPVAPSVGIACLKSVPVDKARDLALLAYIAPFVSFQSTLEILADPPEGYLLPGVDVLGGLEAIKEKLGNDGYNSQYEVLYDLRNIYAAASDNHFDYSPAILSTFLFIRKQLDIVAISSDGVALPNIYLTADFLVASRGNSTFKPSPIKDIDGVSILEFLEKDAVNNAANYQDPDAQFNGLFSSIAGNAVGKAGTSLISAFEIPDSYTINFANGTSLTIENQIYFPPTVDFSGITSGAKFHETFEVPPDATTSLPPPEATSSILPSITTTTEAPTITGYPSPVEIHAQNSIAGYFLNETGYEDTVVLSILSFLPVGFDFSNLAAFNGTDFVLEGRRVLVELFEKAKADGRDKLIIDLQANGGGSVTLAQEVYRLIFPDGEFNALDRYRANTALGLIADANYTVLNSVVLTMSDNFPVDVDNKPIENGDEWFGPYTVEGQNTTIAFQDDKTKPFDSDLGLYLNGEDPNGEDAISKAYFAPENIVIITDGTCASACNILTGLATRNHGVRTIALGGRAIEAPMQAMGGVKGSLLNFNADILGAVTQVGLLLANDTDVIEQFQAAADEIPSFDPAPLLPLVQGSEGGQVNSRNAYTSDDLDGYPVHFRYEAANCKLFYTLPMVFDVTEIWHAVANVAWGNGTCVRGSTVNDDGTIGNGTVEYDPKVRSRVPGLKNPGSLSGDGYNAGDGSGYDGGDSAASNVKASSFGAFIAVALAFLMTA